MPTIVHFWSKVEPGRSDTECWLWTGGIARGGYGLFTFRLDNIDRSICAHRFAYQVERGPIPDGLQLDHLCRVRACVNPAHLEAVTNRENQLRSPISPPGVNFRKTHCKWGHPFDERNTGFDAHGGRFCKACKAKRQKAKLERRRARAA